MKKNAEQKKRKICFLCGAKKYENFLSKTRTGKYFCKNTENCKNRCVSYR